MRGPGIFIASGTANLILNCDSHHNYDPLEDGGNADGFGCHSTGGANVLRGCRAYENSDDGFDFINAPGTCTVEGSWAFRNGYIPDTNMTGANGAGSSRAASAIRRTRRERRAAPRRPRQRGVRQPRIGFYANYHPGGIDFLNNTAFDNPANFDMRTPSGVTSSHKLRNNIAAAPGRDIVSFNGGTDTFNSWTLPVEVTAADFVSMDKAQGLLPRNADGSLPSATFVRLADGSDLIDRGEDVGLPFRRQRARISARTSGATPPSSRWTAECRMLLSARMRVCRVLAPAPAPERAVQNAATGWSSAIGREQRGKDGRAAVRRHDRDAASDGCSR